MFTHIFLRIGDLEDSMTAPKQLTVYRGCTPVVDAWAEGDDEETLVTTLIDALAEAEGVDATALPPLYDIIDLDALIQLLDKYEGATESSALFSFTYTTWNVFVRDDGRIRICDGTQPSEPAPVFESEPV